MTGDLEDRLPGFSAGLSAEPYRAVAALLITDVLIEAGKATRVGKIRLAPPGPDGRRAVVQWTSAAGHGTAPTTPTVEGPVRPDLGGLAPGAGRALPVDDHSCAAGVHPHRGAAGANAVSAGYLLVVPAGASRGHSCCVRDEEFPS
jgi:hypothetical protein